jgi:RpiB/LacA/LacB family sugar-phosphate isomerase
MKIVMGSDHAGFQLKEEVKAFLAREGYEVLDCGTDSPESVDYPDIAEKVAREVLDRDIPGILICGTGIGISIAANKMAGIRAALCRSGFEARMAREHNDANILAIGARITGSGLVEEIVHTFLNTNFTGGRHQRRVDKIKMLEKNCRERS